MRGYGPLALLTVLVACKPAPSEPARGEAVEAAPRDAGLDPWAERPLTPIRCPFLWTVQRDGTTSYILGTFHVGIAAKQLPPAVWDAIEAAPTFALESD